MFFFSSLMSFLTFVIVSLFLFYSKKVHILRHKLSSKEMFFQSIIYFFFSHKSSKFGIERKKRNSSFLRNDRIDFSFILQCQVRQQLHKNEEKNIPPTT
jgi:hypothetical protein